MRRSKITIAAAGFAAMFYASVAGAAEIYQSSGKPLSYTRCYGLADAMPGPAAAFGEDVCVEHVALERGHVIVLPAADGGSRVQWILSQQGQAKIVSQSSGASLAIGRLRIMENGEDLGSDAGCLWSPDGTGAATHASVGACTGDLANLDIFSLYWEFLGETIFRFQASGATPGSWCGLDSTGGQFGPSCL